MHTFLPKTLPSNLMEPKFGKIFRLTSQDGRINQRYEQARIDLVDEYIAQFKEQSPFANPAQGNWTQAIKLMEDVYRRIASFKPPQDHWKFLVVNEPNAPDPVAARYLARVKKLYEEAQKAFPSDIKKRKEYYVAKAQQLAEDCAKHAIDRLI